MTATQPPPPFPHPSQAGHRQSQPAEGKARQRSLAPSASAQQSVLVQAAPLTPRQTTSPGPCHPPKDNPPPSPGGVPAPVYRWGEINRVWRSRLWTEALVVDNRLGLIFGKPTLSVLPRRLDSG